jgi:hypothetical protein
MKRVNGKKINTRPLEPEPEPIEPEIEEAQEVKKEEMLPDFYHFFRNTLADIHEYEIKLYRCEQSANKKIKKLYLRSYYNEIPRESEIGQEFGGGDFWAVSNDPLQKNNDISVYIYIDHLFTRRLRQREEQEIYRPAPQVDPLEHIEKIIRAIKPILELTGHAGQSQAQAMPAYIEKMTETFLSGLGKMQMAMIDRKLESIETQRDAELNAAAEASQQETAMSWIKEVLNFAKPFLNSFLTAKGPAKNIMRNILTQDSRFQKIAEDDELFSLLYTAGAADPEIGQDKMDKLFKDCGFEVPGDLDPVPEPEPAGEIQQ